MRKKNGEGGLSVSPVKGKEGGYLSKKKTVLMRVRYQGVKS